MGTIMNNKYDVTLTDDEREQLASNINNIVEYLKEIVSNFGTSAKLNACWTFYDNVWDMQKCEISIEKTWRYKGVWGASEKEWYTQVRGQRGGLSFNFDEDFTAKELTSSSHSEYALSLLDNWKEIKQKILDQANERNTTRQLVKDFEL